MLESTYLMQQHNSYTLIQEKEQRLMWGDFLSFYSQFYEVIILESIYVITEGKTQSLSLDVKLCLWLKPSSLPPMNHLRFRIDRYIFQVQILQILEFYVKLSFI
jgi:hypothetical protein